MKSGGIRTLLIAAGVILYLIVWLVIISSPESPKSTFEARNPKEMEWFVEECPATELRIVTADYRGWMVADMQSLGTLDRSTGKFNTESGQYGSGVFLSDNALDTEQLQAVDRALASIASESPASIWWYNFRNHIYLAFWTNGKLHIYPYSRSAKPPTNLADLLHLADDKWGPQWMAKFKP